MIIKSSLNISNKIYIDVTQFHMELTAERMKKIAFVAVIIIVFYEFRGDLDFFVFSSKPSTSKFCDITNPYRLFPPQYIRYDDSVLEL